MHNAAVQRLKRTAARMDRRLGSDHRQYLHCSSLEHLYARTSKVRYGTVEYSGVKYRITEFGNVGSRCRTRCCWTT